MNKREQQRRLKGKQEQQAKQRTHNKAFPAAAGAQKTLHNMQRFERIAKSQGIAVARAERKKLKNLEYKKRRHDRKPIFKTIAGWLKPPKKEPEPEVAK